MSRELKMNIANRKIKSVSNKYTGLLVKMVKRDVEKMATNVQPDEDIVETARDNSAWAYCAAIM